MASITRTTITSAMNNMVSLIVVRALISISYLWGWLNTYPMRLITYLPISRIEDIREYQVDNLRSLKPSDNEQAATNPMVPNGIQHKHKR